MFSLLTEERAVCVRERERETDTRLRQHFCYARTEYNKILFCC